MSPTAATAARRLEQQSMATGKTSLNTVSGSRFKPSAIKRLAELLQERLPHYDYLEHGLRFVPDTGRGLELQVCAPYLAELVKPHHDTIQATAKEVMGGRTVAVPIVISGDGFPLDRIGGLIKPHHELIQRRLEELVADAGEYGAWLDKISFAPSGDTITVTAPTNFSSGYCEQHHEDAILKALGTLFGDTIQLRFTSAPDPTKVVSLDLAKRVKEHGGYRGETNLARATEAVTRDIEKRDTDKALDRQKSNFYGTKFMSISLLYEDEVLDRLIGKPREVNALRIWRKILKNVDLQSYIVDIKPVDLAKITNTKEPHVSYCLRLLEEVGAINLVLKNGRISQIKISPRFAYRGPAHLHKNTIDQYELSLEKED